MRYHDVIRRVLARYSFAAAVMGLTSIMSLRLSDGASSFPPPHLLDLFIQHPEELLLALRGVDAPVGDDRSRLEAGKRVTMKRREEEDDDEATSRLTESSHFRLTLVHPGVGLYQGEHFSPEQH